MDVLPFGLKKALESSDTVLFIGAGIGYHYFNDKGEHAPDGYTLARKLADRYSIEVEDDKYELSKVAQVVENRTGRLELLVFLKESLFGFKPDDKVKWLCTRRWKAIYTTNYDNYIQTAYKSFSKPTQIPKTFAATSDIEPVDLRFDIPIYHLHGALFENEKTKIVITENDYSAFRESRRMLFELLKYDSITTTILYIGYSNNDPNWKLILDEISQEFYPSKLPRSFRVTPKTPAIDKEILLSKNIESIDYGFGEFVEIASTQLEEYEKISISTEKIREKVPSDLLSAFETNPSSVTRLLSSWQYVNQERFTEKPNIELFLKGDRASWSLIGEKHYFERDLEETIYDDLLDFATSTQKPPKAKIILAPAGYGVTTLLKILAVKLIKEKAGPVFYLRPGAHVFDGDIEFASEIFYEQRCFFIIDKASDQNENLKSIIHRFKELKRPALFLLGERLNEWRQFPGSMYCDEYMIEPLSDPEIDRLLNFLEENNALNKIESLGRNLQFHAIKKNYNKELLVAMREATEGENFDAIIESEFRNINNDNARKAYLFVCCCYQHGTYLRDSLLSNLIGLNIADLYDEIGTSTEGVIIFDLINESSGMYGARARHRIIAQIVWERCGLQSMKDSAISEILNSLNLNFPIDAKAFDDFYRSDKLVDSISSLDGKIRFFEKACQKDPESPYVRQHYARMLLREEKYVLALSQVEEAMKIDSQIRVLFHTKGHILLNLALSIDSIDIARKRMLQGESTFRKGLVMNERDPYCYQGLSELYLGWANRVDSDESADYVAKAEQIIGEGLRKVWIRDSLWIASANIQRFLGNSPGHIEALERAVRENPGSIIARYLLGRTYRKQRQYNKAIEILYPTIQDHPEEFRSFVEFSLCKYFYKNSYQECIQILQQSTLYGYSDPRFIAHLGGFLFMNNEYTESGKVFDESNKRSFTAKERNEVQLYARDDDRKKYLFLTGNVVVVKAGYSLIQNPQFPRPFLCPGSKHKNLLMKKDMDIIFALGFSAKGIIAVLPRIPK